MGLNFPFQANEKHVGVDMVHTVSIVDFNVPNARTSGKVESLVQGISLVNDSGVMSQNCSLVLLPDLAKESSLRGLWDEEKTIMESMFSFRQHVETRWVDLFTREKKSENKTNIRRFSSGRIAVNGESVAENCWLASELAVCGRPVGKMEGEQGAPTSILPRASALLIPEASSTESDLKLSDRTRPSPEQQSAQKGVERMVALLESLFRHVELKGPVLLVNFCGYVEEVAAAVSQLSFSHAFLFSSFGLATSFVLKLC